MFKLFNKYRLSASLALLLLSIMSSPLTAEEECYCPCESNRFYIGGFGGGIYSNSTKLSQTGVAFFPEDTIGPLAVDARGHTRKKSSGYGGAQIGYEWSQNPIQIGCSNWNITPAAELEAYYYSHKRRGSLINITGGLDEHDFIVSFPMDMGIYMVNGVLNLNSCCLGKFTPYVGGGVGVADICIRKAKSFQISPPEPGINHFDSRRSDSAWAFAAQAKAGLRYNIFNCFHIFAEYRFLFLDTSTYTFGSTIAPGHVPTTTWGVRVNHVCYNAFAFGIQFDL